MPKLTGEQQAVVDAVVTCEEGATILFDSVAGSGKTTTLVAALSEYSMQVDAQGIVAIAYNRQNGETLRDRTEGLADASTFHAWMMRRLNESNFTIQVEDNKVLHKDKALVKLIARRIADVKYRYPVMQLLNMAYNRGYRLGGEDAMINVLEKSSVYISSNIDIVRLLRYAEDLFEESLLEPVLSYDQVVYKFVVFLRDGHITTPRVRFLAIDEYQDFTWPMLEVVRLIQEKVKCRLLIGGDANQGIYAFRGAGIDPMILVHTMFEITHNFVIGTSFRCSKRIAARAAKHVAHFRCLPNAPEGLDEEIKDMGALCAFRNVGVTARYTSELMRAAIDTIRSGNPVRFNREDKIGSLMAKLAGLSNNGAISLDNFKRLIANKIDEVKKGRANPVGASIEIDILNVCRDVYEFIKTTGSTIDEFTRVHLNSRTGPEFGTIHSMKGLEYDTIVVVNLSQMPYGAQKLWECEQEVNATYVAITRGKTNLLHYTIPEE